MFRTAKTADRIKRFLRDESGPTAVEYAIMLALIIVGTIGAILMTGDVQKAMFEDSSNDLKDAFGH